MEAEVRRRPGELLLLGARKSKAMISSEELDEYIDTQLWKYDSFGFEDTELALHIRKFLRIGIQRLNTVDVNDPF
jgi:hypothetical protein